jgi:hypothetical protein
MLKRTVPWVGALVAVVVVVVLGLRGASPPAEAASAPTVVIMRCLAMEGPDFTYQVATLAHTANLSPGIAASTIDAQGDNCAVAISKVLALGLDVNKMTMHATENAVVVTFVK